MTRVAVIADTHLPRGTRALPPKCVEELEGADLILHGGDFVAGEVLEELQGFGRVEAVYGNMDEPALRELLPQRRVVEVGEARIGLVHIPGAAAGRAERLAGWFPDCQAVIYGHTHVPEVTRHGGTLIVNPGSPTERRRAPVHAMAVLDVSENGLEARLIELI